MQDVKKFTETTLSVNNGQLLCTVSQTIPEIILEQFYDDLVTMLNQSVPTVTDVSVAHPAKESDGFCVSKISFLIPKEMENYDDIKTLITSVNNLLTCAMCVILAGNTMLKEQSKINNIFKDFSAHNNKPHKAPEQPTQNCENTRKPCIAAILIKVGTQRAKTANLISDYTKLTKEQASAVFLKLQNGSAGEFLYLFHNTNEANEFAQKMKNLGNEIMLQQ